MKISKVLALVCASMLTTSAAQAEVIVQYATAGSVTSLPAVAESAAVTSDDLVAGSGLTVQTFSTFNFSGWDTASTSFAAAVAANDFHTWGFDVTAPGTTIELTTMDTRWDRSGTGPDDFEIQVSVNGAPGISLLTHDFGDSSAGVSFPGVDLSAVPTLTTGDSVVFTIAAFNSESSGGTFDLETITFPGGTDGIVINGTVTGVPEPTTCMLALVGLAGLATTRRR